MQGITKTFIFVFLDILNDLDHVEWFGSSIRIL